MLVADKVSRGPQNQYGRIPGTLGRSEFGVEIILAIASQVFIIGLSFDKVCLLMNFFQNLKLRNSQADALLNQLSRHWAGEFERLCTLLANSAVYANFTQSHKVLGASAAEGDQADARRTDDLVRRTTAAGRCGQ